MRRILRILRIVIPLLIVLAIATVAVLLVRGWAIDYLIERDIRRVDRAMLSDGQLHVVLCGTGTTRAEPERAGACVAVIAGGQFVMIDAGPGSIRQADVFNLPIDALTAVFLTHLHSDHFGGLGDTIEHSWIWGRRVPLDVYGPDGVEEVVDGFQRAFARDVHFRHLHAGEDAAPLAGARAVAHTIHVDGDGDAPVFERGGLRVLAFLVDHQPVEPAFGYRLEYAGRRVVISGDTRKSERVVRNAAGADVLIHEAMQKDLVWRTARAYDGLGLPDRARQTRVSMDYHTAPVEAAEVAAAASVKTLVLTHVIPPVTNRAARWLFLRPVKKRFHGDVRLAADGMRFDLEPIAITQAGMSATAAMARTAVSPTLTTAPTAAMLPAPILSPTKAPPRRPVLRRRLVPRRRVMPRRAVAPTRAGAPTPAAAMPAEPSTPAEPH